MNDRYIKIFDTHAHYDDEKFNDDRDILLEDLYNGGVKCIVNVTASLSELEGTRKLIDKYDFIYGTAGVHPDDAGLLNDENFMEIEALADHDKVVAVGEIGLDYYWDKSGHDIQKKWFVRQLDLAKRKKLPVCIHSREAAKDTLDIIKAEGGSDIPLNMHCFSYSVEMAREYLNMGHYLGIGGVVTFKNAKKLKEVVEYMPIDRILLETDAPYLTPVPFRGKRNSSDKIIYVVDEISRIKGITPEEVMDITWNNACRFYNL